MISFSVPLLKFALLCRTSNVDNDSKFLSIILKKFSYYFQENTASPLQTQSTAVKGNKCCLFRATNDAHAGLKPMHRLQEPYKEFQVTYKELMPLRATVHRLGNTDLHRSGFFFFLVLGVCTAVAFSCMCLARWISSARSRSAVAHVLAWSEHANITKPHFC